MAMTTAIRTVTWRQVCASVAALLVALGSVIVVVRSDGLPAVEASSSRATRWVVHVPTGRAVLVDGFGGRALASLDLDTTAGGLFVAEGPADTYVLDDSNGSARSIDGADLRLGPPRVVGALGDGRSIARGGPSGLTVANPVTGEGTLVTNNAEPVDFAFDADNGPGIDTTTTVVVAPDGSIWSLIDGSLERSSSDATTTEDLSLDGAVLSLVNNDPLVVDRAGRRARLGTGDWVALPTDIDGSELVAQVPGPAAGCGWVGGGDDLWCVSENGISESATVPDLAIGGGDVLAIAGDAAALVHRGPTQVVQFDWRTEEVLDEEALSVGSGTTLDVSATYDVIWIDDVDGDFVWSVHPFGIEAIDKDASGLLKIGEDGRVIEGSGGEAAGADDGVSKAPEIREPDDNGIDDPPVAVDDPVTARSGSSVPVAVTVNDYDPDGEAIAVSSVGPPGHGNAEVGTASTVVYTPDPGYVGLDEFDYTIVDGDGTEASARVIVDLLPTDGTNRPPVGAPDATDTGPEIAVVVDVLLNDVDPERDGLRIDSVSADATIGVVNETEGPSGIPALEYEPAPGFEGTARFSYQPVDTLGAVGDPVDVTVEVARPGDANRPPVLQPDSVRARRNTTSVVPVLVNDSDPDGDTLTVSVVLPLPEGLGVEVRGDQLAVTPLAGSGESVGFEYEADDGQGHRVRSTVLVSVIDESEPNRPPVVSPDLKTVVVGQTILIDVTANDIDPDGDPLAVVSISRPESGGTVAYGGRNQVEFTPSAIDDDRSANVRFTYTVSDGNAHEVVGDVTVTVLAEPLPEPPYARDDSTFTSVDVPVTVDVLRNDGDPSGERPTLVGTPGCPTGGTATVTADGQVRFTPPTGRSGAFRCSYEVTNSQDLRDTASILVSVREPVVTNSPPIARNDLATIEVGRSISIDVTQNDSDPDGANSALRVTSSTQPPFGTATRTGNVVTFTAGPVAGVATITYQIEDAGGALATGRVQITVTAATKIAPIARPDVRTIVGSAQPTTIDVLANDTDPDDVGGGLTVVSAQLTTGNGSLTRSGAFVTITPQADTVGALIATYTIRDADGLTASSTATLNVQAPVNRPPVAGDDSATVANGASVTVPVLANDSDPDGDPLSIAIVSGRDGSLGTASVSGQSIVFQARLGQAGVAVVGYQVSDGKLTSNADVRITVASCQASQPVATSAFLTTGYRQPIAVNLANYASNGDIVNVSGPPGYANGTYIPPAGENGNVTIRFGVRNQCDQQATGTITIDVNRSPSGQNRAFTLQRGASIEVPVGQLGSDDEALTITGSSGAPGWVTTTPGRLQISVPGSAAFGTTSWTTTVADPGGLTATSTVSVTVANATPTATGDTIDATSGVGTTDLLANDSDPDGSALTIQSIPATVSFDRGGTGAVSRSGGVVTVTTANGVGTARFAYTVVDDGGAVSNPATVIVNGPTTATTTTTTTSTTLPVNTAPVATSQSVSVVVGNATNVNLAVSDADGNGLSIIELGDPSGVVVASSGTSLTILAPSEGTFQVTYRVTDASASSATATVTVNASPAATTTTSTVAVTTTSSTTAPTTPPTTLPPPGPSTPGG